MRKHALQQWKPVHWTSPSGAVTKLLAEQSPQGLTPKKPAAISRAALSQALKEAQEKAPSATLPSAETQEQNANLDAHRAPPASANANLGPLRAPPASSAPGNSQNGESDRPNTQYSNQENQGTPLYPGQVSDEMKALLRQLEALQSTNLMQQHDLNQRAALISRLEREKDDALEREGIALAAKNNADLTVAQAEKTYRSRLDSSVTAAVAETRRQLHDRMALIMEEGDEVERALNVYQSRFALTPQDLNQIPSRLQGTCYVQQPAQDEPGAAAQRNADLILNSVGFASQANVASPTPAPPSVMQNSQTAATPEYPPTAGVPTQQQSATYSQSSSPSGQASHHVIPGPAPATLPPGMLFDVPPPPLATQNSTQNNLKWLPPARSVTPLARGVTLEAHNQARHPPFVPLAVLRDRNYQQPDDEITRLQQCKIPAEWMTVEQAHDSMPEPWNVRPTIPGTPNEVLKKLQGNSEYILRAFDAWSYHVWRAMWIGGIHIICVDVSVKMNCLHKALMHTEFANTFLSFGHTMSDYRAAIATMEEYWGGTERWYRACVDELKQSPVVRENNLDDARRFRRTLQQLLRATEKPEYAPYRFSSEMTSLLYQKLPEKYTSKWEDYCTMMTGVQRHCLFTFQDWFYRFIVQVLERRPHNAGSFLLPQTVAAPVAGPAKPVQPHPVTAGTVYAVQTDGLVHEGGTPASVSQPLQPATPAISHQPQYVTYVVPPHAFSPQLQMMQGAQALPALESVASPTGEAPQEAEVYAAQQHVQPKMFYKPISKPDAAKRPHYVGSRGNQSDRAAEAARRGGEKDPCQHCNAPHLIVHCPWFLSLAFPARKSYLKQIGRCVQCFYVDEPDHSKKCKGAKCRMCAGPHHTLLCHLSPKTSNEFELQWEKTAAKRENIYYCLNVVRLNDPTTVEAISDQYSYQSMSAEEMSALLQESYLQVAEA